MPVPARAGTAQASRIRKFVGSTRLDWLDSCSRTNQVSGSAGQNESVPLRRPNAEHDRQEPLRAWEPVHERFVMHV